MENMDLNFHHVEILKDKKVQTDDEVKYDPGSGDHGYTIAIDEDEDETEWDVDYLEFHEPSEHTVDGSNYDAELHIVHKDGDKKMIVAVFLDKSADDKGGVAEFLDRFEWDDLGDETVNLPLDFFLNELPDKTFWHYKGSLTTPECEEGVDWYVY